MNQDYECRRLENKLDQICGFNFWKTYSAAAFFSNLSSPINLSITIFTALSTTFSSTSYGSSFISSDVNQKLNIVTFLLSIINSFYQPQKQLNELNEYLAKWIDYGNNFEEIIYSNLKEEEKIEEYKKLLAEVNDLIKDQSIKKRNFLTDFLYTTVKYFFMNSNDRWMKDGNFDFYEQIEEHIELDFDLEDLKYRQKKATFFERVCSCFSCCIKKKPIVDMNNKVQNKDLSNKSKKESKLDDIELDVIKVNN
jgi:hypothetical protein